MLLAIDIGNTHVVVGLYQDDALMNSWRLQSNTDRTVDEYALEVLGLLQASRVNPDTITQVAISCVVPPLTRVFTKISQKYFFTEPLVVSHQTVTGLEYGVDEPNSVGADRIVNAVAAVELVGSPVIVVDFGTATTFDVVNNGPVYCGGVIAPGVVLSATALSERAAQLPFIEINRASKIIGKNTKDSMAAGIYFGYMSLVEGTLSRIVKEMKTTPKIIATGGLGRLFSEDSQMIEQYIPDLTLRGLQLIARRNISSKN